MRFQVPLTAVSFLGLFTCAHGLVRNLRNPAADAAHNRAPGKSGNTKSDECVVVVVALLETDPGTIEDTVFECEMAAEDMNGYAGLTRGISGTANQMGQLKSMLAKGELKSGETLLKHGRGASFDENKIHIPPGLVMKDNTRRDRSRRRLVEVTGDKPILAVRVVDNTTKAHPHSPQTMSENIFGPNEADPVNLSSQLRACSFNQLRINPGEIDAAHELAPGVIEVTIPIDIAGGSDRYAIHNAVTTAVQDLLGHGLPGPYQQVMYMLEKCYTGCGWAAYAYINSWMSVYQGNYYYMTGVQIHELGHNFGLAHSGGLNGATYTDHTGMMGNPLYSDDVGKMCYNPAKNYALGWYDANGGKLDLGTNLASFGTEMLTMVGISEYDVRTDKPNQPVVTKLETGTSTDYFVGFNRANKANSQNDEADNEVTIVSTGNNGVSYSQSFLKATLVQDEVHAIANFRGTDTLSIKAMAIDISSSPGVATICITFGDPSTQCVTTPATDAPTKSPTKAPTNFPTHAPTISPTKAPIDPTNPPTKSPTRAPTNSPTNAPIDPTNSPTKSPTLAPTAAPTKAPIDPTNPPTKAPTHAPTVSPTKSPIDPTNPPTKSPTRAPTVSPTKSPIDPTNPPTKSPTRAPTVSPTKAPIDPTNPPTKSPTRAPTDSPTKGPTLPPTPTPTRAPVKVTCASHSKKRTCEDAGCNWVGNGWRAVCS